MLDKLEAIYEKYVYIEEQLGDPSVVSDMDRFTKLNKEYKSLEDLVKVYKEYQARTSLLFPLPPKRKRKIR